MQKEVPQTTAKASTSSEKEGGGEREGLSHNEKQKQFLRYPESQQQDLLH